MALLWLKKQDGGMSAPRNKEEDLQGYIKVIMNGSDETFRANWGNYP